MTAEIAILNKTAVALAADSAVTISAGQKEEKIFDTADKLFELSNQNPIGVMIYNGMNFMETPLPSLIRQFRTQCVGVKKVDDCAESFLHFLHAFGRDAPDIVKRRSIRAMVLPVIEAIDERAMKKFQEKVFGPGEIKPQDIKATVIEMVNSAIEVFQKVIEGKPNAEFVGRQAGSGSDEVDEVIREVISDVMPNAEADQQAKLVAVGRLVLQKAIVSGGHTGVVIAGFGAGELFPTLVSFEIDGMVQGRLKFVRTNRVDIDRAGPRAQVIPFAQKEMVERFLYGLDDGLQRKVATFCSATIPNIAKEILNRIEFEPADDVTDVTQGAKDAEGAFLSGLSEAFEEIRTQSRAEIEDMVEFMPKPELATMAEALVNLTSIKRRVSRGMETVGGPIDVAVISQSEGFVWIKRKHYFPPELNARYFERVGNDLSRQEMIDGAAKRARGARAARGGKKSASDSEKGNVEGPPNGSGGDSKSD